MHGCTQPVRYRGVPQCCRRPPMQARARRHYARAHVFVASTAVNHSALRFASSTKLTVFAGTPCVRRRAALRCNLATRLGCATSKGFAIVTRKNDSRTLVQCSHKQCKCRSCGESARTALHKSDAGHRGQRYREFSRPNTCTWPSYTVYAVTYTRACAQQSLPQCQGLSFGCLLTYAAASHQDG